jgi:uncharacterized membrane protein YfhO
MLSPGHLRLDVRTGAEAWVVVSESAWRGWKAFDAAGRRIALRRANETFLAFRAPAGTTRIDLVYRPRAFILGAAISAFALVALAVTALVVRMRK